MSAPNPGLNPEAGKQLNEYLLELRLPAIRPGNSEGTPMPNSAASTIAASSTVRANTPTVSKVVDSGNAPSVG